MNGRVLDDCALLLSDDDNVATAIGKLTAGETVTRDGRSVTLREDVPFGHKIALAEFEEGDSVRKYGEVIGRTTAAIAPGEWVHTHNCESTRGRGDLDAAGDRA